jgi:hypothetical protein
MPVTIQLLADFGLYPFWIDKGNGTFEAQEPEKFQARFALPDHVMCAILTWDEVYQAILIWDDPASTAWSSPEAHQRYIEQGRAASRLLRLHIPDDVRIRYVAAGEILAEYY